MLQTVALAGPIFDSEGENDSLPSSHPHGQFCPARHSIRLAMLGPWLCQQHCSQQCARPHDKWINKTLILTITKVAVFVSPRRWLRWPLCFDRSQLVFRSTNTFDQHQVWRCRSANVLAGIRFLQKHSTGPFFIYFSINSIA